MNGTNRIAGSAVDELEDRLAGAAYSGYCEHRGWKSFDGKPLPTWPEVTPEIKAGWVAAVRAVYQELERGDAEKLQEPR